MIQKGSQVTIHYTLSVDGQVVESSRDAEPLSYVQGNQQILPALESQLEGLTPGDTRTTTLDPEDGYGVRDEKMVQTVPASAIPESDKLQVGETLQVRGDQGVFAVTVVGLVDGQVTLDLNHPLAGKTLKFDVEVLAVA